MTRQRRHSRTSKYGRRFDAGSWNKTMLSNSELIVRARKKYGLPFSVPQEIIEYEQVKNFHGKKYANKWYHAKWDTYWGY